MSWSCRTLEDFEYKNLPHIQRAICKRFFLLAAEISPCLPDGPRKQWCLEALYQSMINAKWSVTQENLTEEETQKLSNIVNFDPSKEISGAYQIDHEGVKRE